MNFPLMGFASTTTYPLGVINLPVFVREGCKPLALNVIFIMVDAPVSYNDIFGQSKLNTN